MNQTEKNIQFQMCLSNYINKIVYIGLLLLTFNSCDSQVDFRVQFAKALEQIMLEENPKKLETIKNKSSLDLSIYSSIDIEINKAFNSVSNPKLMRNYLDSLSNSSIEQNIYCTLLLSRQINSLDFNDEQMYSEWEQLVQRHKKGESSIIRKNEKYKVGDTVSAFFIKEMDFEPPRLAYNKYLSDTSYYMSEDFCKVLGVIVTKEYNTLIGDKKDTNSLLFGIKIIAINEANVFFGNDFAKIGATIEIEVSSYGRILGNRNDYYKWKR